MTDHSTQTLTRAHIKSAIHHALDLTLTESGVLLESILNEIPKIIAHGNNLKIVSFGTFLIHEKKSRIGRNPKTKKEVMISPRYSVSFRPSVNLREKVNYGKV